MYYEALITAILTFLCVRLTCGRRHSILVLYFRPSVRAAARACVKKHHDNLKSACHIFTRLTSTMYYRAEILGSKDESSRSWSNIMRYYYRRIMCAGDSITDA